MYTTFRATPHVGRHRTMVLPGSRIQDLWITGIHDHVSNTGPLPCAQYIFPGLTTVGRLVKTALTTRGPQGSLHCRENGL